MEVFIIIILLSLISLSEGQATQCSSSIKWRTCGHYFNQRYNYVANYESINLQRCPGSSYMIKWFLRNTVTHERRQLSKYNDKVEVMLPPRSVFPGKYELLVTVKEEFRGGGSRKPTIVFSWCELEFYCETPSLLFKQGPIMYVKNNTMIWLDLTPSINFDRKPLKTSWSVSCKFVQGCTPPPICPFNHSLIALRTVFRHHNSKHRCIEHFYYTGYVVFNQTHKLNTTLKVTATPDVSLYESMEIVCLKNCRNACYSYSSRSTVIIFKVVCLKSCSKIDPFEAKWTIEVPGRQIEAANYKAYDGRYFQISPSTFNYGEKPIITVTKGKYQAYFEVVMLPNAVASPKCTLETTSGKALETDFKVNCLQGISQFPIHYVYINSGQEDETVFYKSDSMAFGFKMAASQNALKYSGTDGFYRTTEKLELAQVQVASSDLNMEKARSHLQNFMGMYEFGDITALVNYGSVLLEEARLASTKLQVEDIYQDVTRILKKVVQNDVLIASSVIDSYTPTLCQFNTTLSNPFLNKLFDFLLALIKSYRQALKEHLCPDLLNKILPLHISKIEKCATNYFQHYLIKPPNITAPKVAQLQKDNSDFEDPEKYVPDYAIRIKAINLLFELHILYVFVTAESEKPVYGSKDPFVAYLSNTRAKTISKHEVLEGNDANLKFLKSFRSLGEVTLTVVFVSLNKSVLNFDNGFTAPVAIGFFDEKHNEMVLKKQHFQLNFLIPSVNDFKSLNEFIINNNYDVTKEANHASIMQMMTVHRVKVFLGSTLYVKFEIESSDEFKIKFMLKRPTLRNVNQDKAIDVNSKNLIVINPYDIEKTRYLYMGVWPKDTKVVNEAKTYSYRAYFMLLACVTYTQTDVYSIWEVNKACQAKLMYNKKNSSNLRCICSHTSILSGKVKEVQSYIIHYYYPNYTVLIHTSLVLCCYCIALCFYKIRLRQYRHARRAVYFIADTEKNDRYGYLLAVQTGDKYFAGTTSNIYIQIFGSENSTKPHRLNYPDPEKRLLQRDNMDYFVLGNLRYLGEITHIEIWFDCVGYRPYWYCQSIAIIDLQKREKWFFHVNRWLEIGKEEIIYHKIEPSPEIQPRKTAWFYFKNATKFSFGPIHTWNIFSSKHDNCLPYEKRLTVILSTIYTTYAILVITYLSAMKISDTFGYGNASYFWTTIGFALISSVISSGIHFPIIYIFRNCDRHSYDLNIIVYENCGKFPLRYERNAMLALVVWVCLCTIFLVYFGFSITKNISLYWIISTIISLLISIFIFQNMYIILYYVLIGLYGQAKIRKYNFLLILKEIEAQRRVLFKTLGESLFRPYLIYANLNKNEILQRGNFNKSRWHFNYLSAETLMFLLYLIILIFVADIEQQETLIYHNRLNIKSMIYYDKLKEISSIEGVYNYLNTTILDMAYPTEWYKNYTIENDTQDLLRDLHTHLIGVIQLRQERREQNCKPPINIAINCSNDPHMKVNGSGLSNHQGDFEIYSGAGFKVLLNRDKQYTKNLINTLKSKGWIDINTKVLFIEFWTYNANVHLFNAVQIIIERHKTGYYSNDFEALTAHSISKVLQNTTFWFKVYWIIFIILFIAIFARLIVILLREKLKIFTSGWNILDMVILVLSILFLFFKLHNKIVCEILVDTLVKTHFRKNVIELEIIPFLWINTQITAWLLFFLTIRLWRFVNFGKVSKKIDGAVINTVRALIDTLIYNLFITIVFGIYFYLTLGSIFKEFSPMLKSIISLFLLEFKSLSLNSQLINYFAFPIIFFVYFVLTIIFNYIFIVITMLALNSAKHVTGSIYTMKDFFVNESCYHGNRFKVKLKDFRLKGGADAPEPRNIAYPKEPEERYAHNYQLERSKLKRMTLIAINRLVNFKLFGNYSAKLSEEDVTVMAKLYLSYILDDKSKEKHMFFMEFDKEKDKVAVVSDSRLLQMEYLLNLLPQSKREEAKEVLTVSVEEKYRKLLLLLKIQLNTLENVKIRVKAKKSK